MRMLPSKYAAKAQPVTVKKGGLTSVSHATAPLKGLSLSGALAVGKDPLKATILDNWLIEEDKVRCRPGRRKIYAHADGKPIESLVPYYGTPIQNMGLATNGKFTTYSGITLHTGYLGNDWSWTSFANLGTITYTLMVNGFDGVWSWDGTNTPQSAAVTVTSLSNANPAVATVAAADISKFSNGMIVFVAGADATHSAANGYHVVGSLNTVANTFALVGVNTSAASGAQTSGVTVAPAGGLVKEAVTAPASASWIDPNKFAIILNHQNHVWFADTTNLAVYYLPLQQKSGEVKYLPLNALFKRGGTVRAIFSWTVDGGDGMDDKLVIFSSNGECAIYSGTDPDSDYSLVGVFRFDSPMSKHCVTQYGGELYVLISTGLVPMSTLMRAQVEHLGQTDRDVYTAFSDNSRRFRDLAGWQAFIDPSTSRIICNMPQGGANRYQQLVRFMPTQYWTSWSAIPARSFGWLNNVLYLGDDSGNLFASDPAYLDDDGMAIKVDVQLAWSNFKTPGVKQFKMVKAYIITDGAPKPAIDIQVDYQTNPPQNQPELTFTNTGGEWDVADWDTTDWAAGATMIAKWSGVGRLGTVGAFRMQALIKGCEFSFSGADILYETGSVMG